MKHIPMLVLALSLWGQTAIGPADKPAPIAIEDREPILKLRFDAAMVLARINDARRRHEEALKEAAQAQMDTEHQESALAVVNQSIDERVKELRERYKAPASLWDIEPSFEWATHKVVPQGASK